MATFPGGINTITGTFGSKGGGSYGILIQDNDQSNVRLRFTNTGGSNTWDLIGGLNAANNNDFSIRDITNSVNALRIVPVTGAATFSSSINASGFYAVAGNSARFYRGSNDYYWRIHNDANNFLNFGTYTSADAPYLTNPKLILFDSGNIAIGSGTDDTTNKLQVTGSGKFTGDLGVGITPSVKFQVNNGTNINLGIKIGQTDVNAVMLNAFNDNLTANIPLEFRATTYTFTVGTVTLSNLAGTGSRAVLADANGLLSAPVSDISVKENINTIGYGLSEILKMNPVWFDYIDEYKNYGKTRQNGNIAQEMESIIPEAVFTTPSTGKMGINYDQLHAVYIKAIQELKAEIDALKNN